jgi:hypothetical protein
LIPPNKAERFESVNAAKTAANQIVGYLVSFGNGISGFDYSFGDENVTLDYFDYLIDFYDELRKLKPNWCSSFTTKAKFIEKIPQFLREDLAKKRPIDILNIEHTESLSVVPSLRKRDLSSKALYDIWDNLAKINGARHIFFTNVSFSGNVQNAKAAAEYFLNKVKELTGNLPSGYSLYSLSIPGASEYASIIRNAWESSSHFSTSITQLISASTTTVEMTQSTETGSKTLTSEATTIESTSSETATTERSTTETTASETSITTMTSTVSTTEMSTAETSTTSVMTSTVSTTEMSTAETSTTSVMTSTVSTTEMSATKTTTSEITTESVSAMTTTIVTTIRMTATTTTAPLTTTTTITATPSAQASCALKNKKKITAGYWGSYKFTSMIGLCEDYDLIYLSFLVPWSGPTAPTLHTTYCKSDGAKCWSVPEQIAHCQSKGVQIILSIGGSIDSSPGFGSSAEAKNLALLIHNQYGHGTSLSSDNRPIGSQILDGIDLNLEKAPVGGYKYLTDFVDEMRRLEPTWCLTASPQCYLGFGGKDQNVGDIIVQRSFDLLNIQFYNNPSCNNGQPGFYTNFNDWLKPGVSNGAKLLVGALLTSGSGIVSSTTFGNQLVTLNNTLSTTDKHRLGGFAIWAVDADASKDFVTSVKSIYV